MRDVVRCDRIGVVAHNLLSSLPKNLSPSLDAVVSDTFSNVVAIEAHTRDELLIEAVIRGFIFEVFDNHKV